MRRSKYGLAIRAASENGERATLLGVPVPRLDTIIWVIAAVLSTVAILLQTPVLGFGGFQTVTTGSDDVLIRILAAAVIGRMESMPRTAIAAIAIGIFDAGATWTYSNTTFVDATLVLVIIGRPPAPAQELQPGDRGRPVDAGGRWRRCGRSRGPWPRCPRSAGRFGPARSPWSRWPSCSRSSSRTARPTWPATSSSTPSSACRCSSSPAGRARSPSGQFGICRAGRRGRGRSSIRATAGTSSPPWPSRSSWGPWSPSSSGSPRCGSQGPFLAVTTLAFGVCASVYLLSPSYLTWFVTTSANRPSIFGSSPLLSSDTDIYYFCLIGFFLCLMAVRSLRRSRIGRSLIATRDNEAAARATALNTTRQKLTAFLISGAIAGFAGALFVVQQQGVNNGSFTADIDIALFTMVVIGGLGSLPGVVLGAFAVWAATYFLPSGWAALVNGGGILLLLIFLPEGLGGIMYRVRDALLGLVAKRRHMTSLGLIQPIDELDGQIGEDLLVAKAAEAAEQPGVGDRGRFGRGSAGRHDPSASFRGRGDRRHRDRRALRRRSRSAVPSARGRSTEP